MKLFSLFSAAAALVVATALTFDPNIPIPADLTSVIYITTTVDPEPPTFTTGRPLGKVVTECPTNALCGDAPPPKQIDVYAGTVTRTRPIQTTTHIPVTQFVTLTVVEVTSVAVATRGICPKETTKSHASNITVWVDELVTQYQYEVTTITDVTTTPLVVTYTADDACTIKSYVPPPARPTSPGAPERSVTALGDPEVTEAPPAPPAGEADQQPMGGSPPRSADEE